MLSLQWAYNKCIKEEIPFSANIVKAAANCPAPGVPGLRAPHAAQVHGRSLPVDDHGARRPGVQQSRAAQQQPDSK